MRTLSCIIVIIIATVAVSGDFASWLEGLDETTVSDARYYHSDIRQDVRAVWFTPGPMLQKTHGLKEYMDRHVFWFGSAANMKIKVESNTRSGDKIIIEARAIGKHKSGKSFDFPFVVVTREVAGKVQEAASYSDFGTYLRQAGLEEDVEFPPPKSTACSDTEAWTRID